MNKKFCLSSQLKRNYGAHHRSGWGYVIDCLSDLHTESGIPLETFIEKKFVFGGEQGEALNNFTAYLSPWIGIAHVPNNLPFLWDNSFTPKEYIKTPEWHSSVDNCIGIFATSKYLAEQIETLTNIKVDSFFHPTSFECKEFSFQEYRKSDRKHIVQLGVYARKLTSIFRINTEINQYKRMIVGLINQNHLLTLLNEAVLFNLDLINNVEICGYLSDNEYDELLYKNIGFVDIFDSSANNAIIECMARATPIIVKRHSATIEYLGDDYPLYFENPEDVDDTYLDEEILYNAHIYLKNRREIISKSYFLETITNSEIYKLI